MDEAPRPLNGWRFSKDVPISVVGFLLLQAILLIVSYVDLVGTVKGLVAAQVVSQGTAYTKDDARKDRELSDSKLARIQDKEEEITRRIALIEAQFNELRARVVK
jgi:hypothetical protein